jgi:lauroyl/myristoyl acyltransferase
MVYNKTWALLRRYSQSARFRQRRGRRDKGQGIAFLKIMGERSGYQRPFSKGDLWARNLWHTYLFPDGTNTQFLDTDFLAAYTTIRGQEHLEAALASGRGALIVSAHFCFTPLIFQWVSRVMRREAVQINLQFTEETAEQTIQYARTLRAAARTLALNGVVVTLPDGYQGRQSIQRNFFGVTRPFYLGTWELAVLTRAAPLPAWTSIGLDGHLTIEFFPPFEPPPAASSGESVEYFLTSYIDWLEALLCRAADCYKYDHIRFYMQLRNGKNPWGNKPATGLRRIFPLMKR